MRWIHPFFSSRSQSSLAWIIAAGLSLSEFHSYCLIIHSVCRSQSILLKHNLYHFPDQPQTCQSFPIAVGIKSTFFALVGNHLLTSLPSSSTTVPPSSYSSCASVSPASHIHSHNRAFLAALTILQLYVSLFWVNLAWGWVTFKRVMPKTGDSGYSLAMRI